MAFQKLHDIFAWQKLLHHAKIMDGPEKHLRNLIKDKNRLEKFSLHGANIFYDFSRQRVDKKCMDLLFELAETRKLKHRFNCMASGKKVNITENRAVLHTASRSFSGDSVFVASGIRNEIAKKNEKSEYTFEHIDPIAKFYLDTLFSGLGD